MGGGAGTSSPSVSLETDCIKQALNGQTEHWPLKRVGHVCPATGTLGPCAMMQTSGLDSGSGSRC